MVAPWIPFAVAKGIDILGDLFGGDAEEEAEKQNSRIAAENAKIARQNAAEEEREIRIMGAKALGQMRVSYAASGVVSSEGSAADVIAESVMNVEKDAQAVLRAGDQRARGYQMESDLANTRGRNARTKSYYSSASKFLTGAAYAKEKDWI